MHTQKVWVHAVLSEYVDCENGVWEKSSPYMEREVLVSTRYYGYKMLLEGSDGLF